MVERSLQLNSIFASLSDPVRRDILARVSRSELSVSELAANYNMSFAAVSKHLKTLEHASLIVKRKEGKKHMISLAPKALKQADEYLEQYRRMWQSRYNKLEELIK